MDVSVKLLARKLYVNAGEELPCVHRSWAVKQHLGDTCIGNPACTTMCYPSVSRSQWSTSGGARNTPDFHRSVCLDQNPPTPIARHASAMSSHSRATTVSWASATCCRCYRRLWPPRAATRPCRHWMPGLPRIVDQPRVVGMLCCAVCVVVLQVAKVLSVHLRVIVQHRMFSVCEEEHGGQAEQYGCSAARNSKELMWD